MRDLGEIFLVLVMDRGRSPLSISMKELMDYTKPGLTYTQTWLKLYKKGFVSPVTANDQQTPQDMNILV